MLCYSPAPMDLFTVGGGALCVAALAQGSLAVATLARRFRLENERRQIALEEFRVRVDALRKRSTIDPGDGWKGYRKFEVTRKVVEVDGICSFHLAPHDGKPLPKYAPGQFLTFRLALPGEPKPLVRCYSLSSSYDPGFFRVSIKRVAPPPETPGVPPGRASSYFVDSVHEGDFLDVRAPSGKFVLSETDSPVVLLGGGIGLTPVLAMLRSIIASGGRREVWFFYGVRNQKEHALKRELETLAADAPNVKLHVVYSDPGPKDAHGSDYHSAGHLSLDLLRGMLPSNNYEFYVCGPPGMMSSLVEGLEKWGVPESRIFAEAFGPASVKRVAPAPIAAPAPGLASPRITFSRSGKTVEWTGAQSNLLDLALASGIKIDSGCGAGNCQTCITAVKQGDVVYVKKPETMPEGGSCLVCIATPKGNLTLDA